MMNRARLPVWVRHTGAIAAEYCQKSRSVGAILGGAGPLTTVGLKCNGSSRGVSGEWGSAQDWAESECGN